VIRQHLEALDRGLEPPELPGAGPRVPMTVVQDSAYPTADSFARDASELRLSRDELVEAAGIDVALLDQIESYGLVRPRSGGDHYDGDALVIAQAVAEMSAFGIEPRHLRSFKAGADREVGLIEQVVTPLLRQRSTDARARAEDTVRQLAALSVRLHGALVKSMLDPDLRS
jgi:hypothetical protein